MEGIVALATALPFPECVERAGWWSPRVFFGHGRFDSVVSPGLGKDSYRILKEQGYETEWHSYWCGHVLGTGLLRDVRRFLAPHQAGLGCAAPSDAWRILGSRRPA